MLCNIADFCYTAAEKGIANHIDFIGGIAIGMTFLGLYHTFIGIRSLKKSYERTISEQERTIRLLTELVHKRLEDVQVEKKDKQYFQGLKKFFRNGFKRPL